MTDAALMGAVVNGGRSDMLNDPELGGMRDPNMLGDTRPD
jgi:hypothetical protein